MSDTPAVVVNKTGIPENHATFRNGNFGELAATLPIPRAVRLIQQAEVFALDTARRCFRKRLVELRDVAVRTGENPV